MGVFSIGLVSMGVTTLGLVSMGVASFGQQTMGLLRPHAHTLEVPNSEMSPDMPMDH